jgi:xanthosine utilization system XapX-like protein
MKRTTTAPVKSKGQALPVRATDETARLDLVDDAALLRDGFPARARDQEKFLAVVVTRRYGRAERSTLPALGPLAGAGALVAGIILELARQNAPAAITLGGAVALLIGLAVARLRRQKARALREGEPDAFACFSRDGVLHPRLDSGERVILDVDATGPDKRQVRLIAGGATALWGLLLAGLPLSVMPSLGSHPLIALVVLAASATGALVFGRGVQSLTVVRPAARFVLTDRRVFLAYAEGVGESIPLTALRHRPVVVDRGQGRATLALDVRPLASVAPLAVHGLVGLDDVENTRAVDAARAVMVARKRGDSR